MINLPSPILGCRWPYFKPLLGIIVVQCYPTIRTEMELLHLGLQELKWTFVVVAFIYFFSQNSTCPAWFINRAVWKTTRYNSPDYGALLKYPIMFYGLSSSFINSCFSTASIFVFKHGFFWRDLFPRLVSLFLLRNLFLCISLYTIILWWYI